MADEFIVGEYQRTLDERFRVSIPAELSAGLGPEGSEFVLVKERRGCLSVWNKQAFDEQLNAAVDLVRSKMRAGKLEGRLGQVQVLGRLLSTRHRPVQMAGRNRLLIPEEFREFLEVGANGNVLIVGAAICVEIWNPGRWVRYLEGRMPRFRRLLDRLSG